MFSGIVEGTGKILDVTPKGPGLRVRLQRPSFFDDLKIGDSIAVNGVCLTVEQFDPSTMEFTLGPETLRVTGWTAETLLGREMNLERSLRMSDRVHGHFVTGHVAQVVEVQAVEHQGEFLEAVLSLPAELRPFLWPKGSVALNGVSLTINHVDRDCFKIHLIPETLRRTNLKELRVGDRVNLEIDPWAWAVVHQIRLREEQRRGIE